MSIAPQSNATPPSIGLQLVRSIINASARQIMSQINDQWFNEAERPAWNAFSLHYRTQGVLASVQTMLELGFRLPQASEPPGFYMARLNARAVYATILSEQPDLAEAMRSRNASAAAEVVQRMARATAALAVTQDTSTLADEFDRVLEDYAHAAANPGIQGITLGWPRLDEITGGLEPGDVGVYVGRPGMGKSYLMARSALSAWQAGHSVLFVTNEMTARQIARRVLALFAGVDPTAIRRGNLSQWAMDRVLARVQEARDGAPFYLISGNFKKTVPAVEAAVRLYAPDITYIDASYLMRPGDAIGNAKQWELLSRVGREIKDMASACNIPILHSVQFNRDADKAKQGGQSVGMIGGTDEVGQIASMVIGIAKGPQDRENTQRTLQLIKIRESEQAPRPLLINYLFNPPNFTHIPTDDNGNPVVAPPAGDPGDGQGDGPAPYVNPPPVEAGDFDEWGQP